MLAFRPRTAERYRPPSVLTDPTMPRSSTVVRLTGNYHVSVPKALRDQLGLKLGDFLDTRIERGAVVLRPNGAPRSRRSCARRGIGVSRAYDDADEFITDLHTAARRLKTKRRSR
jgi:bifunctional DNA-binding transcriptional regulator/antitoxin component of YhaV-PrlF toxin-antitoxin module